MRGVSRGKAVHSARPKSPKTINTPMKAHHAAMKARRAEERAQAPALYRTLCALREALGQGEPTEQVLQRGKAALYDAGFTPDYLELRDTALGPVTPSTHQAVLLAAAKLGPARLIDNISVQLPKAARS